MEKADKDLTDYILTNHKSISSFARYNKIDDEHKAEAMKVAFKKVG